jgi:thiol:disulfide interchange protein DsbD
LWVLAQQTSASGLGAALAGAILVALAAWAYQQSRMRSSGGRAASLVTSVVALLLAIALPLQLDGVRSAEARAQAGGAAHADDAWQPYDEAKLAALTASGAPVLVNFTASWCLTCLVNERNAFADPAVQEIFRGKGVTLMKGDWTNRDPAITKALAQFGRAGVPLYLAYNGKPGSPEPVILPQLLSASVVRDAFAALPNHALQ